MPDPSRRQILTGLLAAPVVAPAAAMGMVEAVKATPYFTDGYARPPVLLERFRRVSTHYFAAPDANMASVRINGLPIRGPDGGELAAGDLAPGEVYPVTVDLEKGEARIARMIRECRVTAATTTRPLVTIDPAGGDEHVECIIDLPDVLTDDQRAFCAVV